MESIFCIVLHSRYTGEAIHLAEGYNLFETAYHLASQECHRCNRVEVRKVPGDWIWMDQFRGFVKPEDK
jgi:hypothetical protein